MRSQVDYTCRPLGGLGLSLSVSVAGYQWRDVEKCVKWMVPFAMVIRETGSSKLKQFRGVPAEDAHNIQTHLNSLDLLVSPLPVPTRVPKAADAPSPLPGRAPGGPGGLGKESWSGEAASQRCAERGFLSVPGCLSLPRLRRRERTAGHAERTVPL